jgi:hypothetical protein
MADDVEEALRLSRSYEPALKDYPKREPELKEYRPSLKERIAAALMGEERPSPERRNFAEGLSELAYYVPGIGEAIAGDRLGRSIATEDYLTALKTALGVIPGTGKMVADKLPKAFGGQAYANDMAMVGAKKGGRINTKIDRDPDWDMGLAAGGEVENALRLARHRLRRDMGGVSEPLFEQSESAPAQGTMPAAQPEGAPEQYLSDKDRMLLNEDTSSVPMPTRQELDIGRAQTQGATPSVPPVDVTPHSVPTMPSREQAREVYNTIPTSARLYGEFAAGVQTPVTHKDFTPAERNYLGNMIQQQKGIDEANYKYLKDAQSSDPALAATLQPKVSSYERTQGQTSLGYPSSTMSSSADGRTLKFYDTKEGVTPSQLASNLRNSPATNIAATLGRSQAYDTPQGRVILDKYDFSPTGITDAYSMKTLTSAPMRTLRQATVDYIPEHVRPVAINLDAKPNTEYTYTGPKVTTPSSHRDSGVSPPDDTILSSMSGVPSHTPFSNVAASDRDVPLPPRRPTGLAGGGEVENALRLALKRLRKRSLRKR